MITKAEVLADQIAAPPYGTRLGVDRRDVFELTLSSGTSGNLQGDAYTVRDAHMRAMHGIAFRWAGMQADEDALVFHVGISNSASHGPFHRGIRGLGRLPYLVGHLGFPQRLELMERFGVDHMYAMPSALNGLAQLCEEQGRPALGSLPRTRLDRHLWRGLAGRFHRANGAGVGSSDPRGLRCQPDLRRLCHVELRARRRHRRPAQRTALLRVGDPDPRGARPGHAEPVAPGEFGELVITHLEKEASPLVRFRTRDRVRYLPWTECSCGRCLDMIESGTVGRWDDMIKVKGQNVFPTEVDEIVFARREVGEYQARVFIGDSGRDVAEMRIGVTADQLAAPAIADMLGGLARGAEGGHQRHLRAAAGRARRPAAVHDARMSNRVAGSTSVRPT